MTNKLIYKWRGSKLWSFFQYVLFRKRNKQIRKLTEECTDLKDRVREITTFIVEENFIELEKIKFNGWWYRDNADVLFSKERPVCLGGIHPMMKKEFHPEYPLTPDEAFKKEPRIEFIDLDVVTPAMEFAAKLGTHEDALKKTLLTKGDVGGCDYVSSQGGRPKGVHMKDELHGVDLSQISQVWPDTQDYTKGTDKPFSKMNFMELFEATKAFHKGRYNPYANGNKLNLDDE